MITTLKSSEEETNTPQKCVMKEKEKLHCPHNSVVNSETKKCMLKGCREYVPEEIPENISTNVINILSKAK